MARVCRTVPPLSLAELRALVGVPEGACPAFAELNRAVLQRALQDINAVTPLCMGLQPFRVGRRAELFELLRRPEDDGLSQTAGREARRAASLAQGGDQERGGADDPVGGGGRRARLAQEGSARRPDSVRWLL